MAEAKDLKALVDRIPALDEVDQKDKRDLHKLTGPPWPQAEELCEAVLAGGKANVLGLIDMLKEVDDGSDYKARYLLHIIAAYVTRPGKEAQRTAVVEAIASQIGGARPKPVQAFLIQELETVGDARVAGALGKLLTDEELCAPAARTLMAVGAGALEQLRAALPRTKGRARVSAVQNLGALRDAASIDAFKRAAGDADVDVRIAGAWALANLGDPAGVEAVLKAADAKEGWERIQGAKAAMLLAEKLLAAGRKPQAARVYTHLRDTRTDPKEDYIRQQAIKALAATK